MMFEEQITQAFETLTERLRGEIDQEVRRRVEHAAVSASAPAGPAAAVDDLAARERLADGFETIDRARSLTDVLDALVTFARHESARADLWLIRGGRPHLWRSPGSGEDDDAPPPDDRALPLTISGTTVAQLVSEPRTANDAPRTANGEPRTTNLALLTRYAGRSLEALTAFKTARALTHHDSADGGLRIADDEASEEDTSARRYARLLVSEIKLYHEAAVIDGRRDRDLQSRLGGEITRARVMYEQRVPAHVRERADYFQDELVNTLANGDAGLLEVRT